MKKNLSLIGGFAVLFCCYHAAEYMIVKKNNPAGFLGFQLCFFVMAFFIARWQFKKGLAAWGLDGRKKWLQHLGLGMLMGVVVYGLTFIIGLLSGAERIESVPSLQKMGVPLGLFIFGNFFSSLSEDVLTRGYVFRHGYGKMGSGLLGFISALMYVLNHIYRLTDGVETWSYLFSLGVLFIIPLIRTQRLWFTGGMHWAGNCFFYFSHEIIPTQTTGRFISPNYILVLVILMIIPVNNILLKKKRMLAS